MHSLLPYGVDDVMCESRVRLWVTVSVRVRVALCFLLANDYSTVKRVPVAIFLPSPFVCSTEWLFSNRLPPTFHHSLLQGHIQPSRRPRRLQPAPLVLQVLLSQ